MDDDDDVVEDVIEPVGPKNREDVCWEEEKKPGGWAEVDFCGWKEGGMGGEGGRGERGSRG